MSKLNEIKYHDVNANAGWMAEISGPFRKWTRWERFTWFLKYGHWIKETR